MTKTSFRPRGQYFEEFELGQSLVTAGRTITEADVVRFAGLSGDYNQIHTDAEYSATEMLGQRVAHGLLVVSVATGLVAQTGIMEGTVLVFRELDWKFSQPVMLGDTVHAELLVTETKALPRLGGGNVTAKVTVRNQDGQVVQRGNMSLLMKSRES